VSKARAPGRDLDPIDTARRVSDVSKAIPMAAQIVTVADAYDAMTSDRPYRLGRSTRSAVREIFAHSGA